MMEIYALQVPNEVDTKLFLRLLSCVSMEKRERIKRFLRIEDSLRTLFADLLIRSIISDKYGIPNKEITFIYNSYGKPFLEWDRDFAFNVSHSGKWVVAIVGNRQLVGIDIEEILPMEMELAKNFFSLDDYICLMKKREKERLEYFYEQWTLKESYVKAIGRGLSVAFDSFVISREGEEGRFTIHQNHCLQSFFFRQYEIDPAYKLSACSTTDAFPDTINICEDSTLYRKFNNV
ncbi:4'-phosphopantetheinyl transferase superfamily protein [Brevibacillus borstelensis]|uniref:4'-phosphopantetheinyl transferase family protein n=1 Tax=Brevibacillus TaxID=55080 RepID=UPI002E232CA3|nr:4'-phosphopantetheinyl transferase superfamily protein [Brevibacillus borstelensis]MED1744784.1 4'-phosphopantetheinyl transferase superfamily protein [Brevibacillus borstelensis]MED1876401.1 4'-phosphopantetheinyl transferase superfamily protein [Brevibacillus borstelensis]